MADSETSLRQSDCSILVGAQEEFYWLLSVFTLTLKYTSIFSEGEYNPPRRLM